MDGAAADSPLRRHNTTDDMIEENIENVQETTNGAKEMQSQNDTCTSMFYKAPIQGGILVKGTIIEQQRRPFTPPFAQLAKEQIEATSQRDLQEQQQKQLDEGMIDQTRATE